MAVEQAAFVTCNSFRLLQVFNRHVKLKEEEACRKEGEREWRQKRENRDITEDENRQREDGEKSVDTCTQEQGNNC